MSFVISVFLQETRAHEKHQVHGRIEGNTSSDKCCRRDLSFCPRKEHERVVSSLNGKISKPENIRKGRFKCRTVTIQRSWLSDFYFWFRLSLLTHVTQTRESRQVSQVHRQRRPLRHVREKRQGISCPSQAVRVKYYRQRARTSTEGLWRFLLGVQIVAPHYRGKKGIFLFERGNSLVKILSSFSGER